MILGIYGFYLLWHINSNNKWNGTHRSTMFHDVQALLDMLQRSRNSHILILLLTTHSKGIYNSFELIPLFKRVIYKYKTETFVP